jgi:hypothetical protein
VPAGVESASWAFPWQDQHGEAGYTVWGVFRSSTGYFGNSGQPFMVNFRVSDLDGALKRLRQAGAQVDARIEKTVGGRFGWLVDPDGRRVELREPAPIDWNRRQSCAAGVTDAPRASPAPASLVSTGRRWSPQFPSYRS